MYVYTESEHNLWTVGFYKPNGNWETDSDWPSREEAGARVHYLNGGNQETKEGQKEQRKWEKSLKDLTLTTGVFLRQLDDAMKDPSTTLRGKRIAQLGNYLEMARDKVRYFTLGVDFRHDPEIKNGMRLMPESKKGEKIR